MTTTEQGAASRSFAEIPFKEISDAAVMNKRPLASVRMATYNHEPYIAQAIEGVLMQETDFPFELLIGEDCSTDRTREIVLGYQRRHPHVIRVVLWDRNAGAATNTRLMNELTRGKYVALCEGDDYWIHPKKLQRQVGLLEEHPDSELCYSDGVIASEIDHSQVVKKMPLTEHNRAGIPDLLKGLPLTCTLVYRKTVIDSQPDWFRSLKLGTHAALIFFSTRFGEAIHLPESTAVYRIHAGGICSGIDDVARLEALSHNALIYQRHFGPEGRKHFKRRRAQTDLNLSLAYERANRRSDARRAALRAAFSCPGVAMRRLVIATLSQAAKARIKACRASIRRGMKLGRHRPRQQ